MYVSTVLRQTNMRTPHNHENTEAQGDEPLGLGFAANGGFLQDLTRAPRSQGQPSQCYPESAHNSESLKINKNTLNISYLIR